MASLELIRHIPRRAEVVDGRVRWVHRKDLMPIDRLPQICWKDGRTWAEANLWALQHATSQRKDLETVKSAMRCLHAYAKWLEQEDVNWWHFPARESDRCLHRYRGALIAARNSGQLAPSLASARMSTVVRFYRWLEATRLLSPEWPMWSERQIGIQLTDTFGLQHTLNVRTTSLAIPNRRVAGSPKLEGGLLPVSTESALRIMDFADSVASPELALMLRLGFQTGLRLGSICDLKMRTIERAVEDPTLQGWHRLSIGPGAHPPVRTKFGVTGQVPIPNGLLTQLRVYAFSTRRLKRQSLAAKEHRETLFLNRFGAPYLNDRDSRAVNVEMGRLRKAGVAAGVNSLYGFNFHRTRATFATELARASIRAGMNPGDALVLVRDACLHRHEQTTWRYIHFVEKSAAMAEIADAFTGAMMGLVRNAGGA
ncbi:tyrosine-type recombinase/integrase [uncultured Aquimonas sp.]|uniref:tyrosine-type recombinase/integrase n=1 Tax=uncultured Aquimonas sp. TaxID=385483 RepID=UPI00260A0016|nr:tyrosine-type recombinase/integrase [uncultured Aquimonas sp.]